MPPKQRAGKDKGTPVKEHEAEETVVLRSWNDVQYVGEILADLGKGNAAEAARKIGAVEEVHVPDYEVNVKGAALVGWWGEAIVIGHERRWPAATVSLFLVDLHGLFQLAASGADLCEMKIKLKSILKKYAEHHKPDFTADDIACIAEHIATGLFQHYLLFQEVLMSHQPPPVEIKRVVVVRQPAIPKPLAAAEKNEVAGKKKVEAEEAYRRKVEELRQAERDEAARIKAEQVRAEEEEAARRQRDQEERDMEITLDDEKAKETMKALQNDVQKTLRQRQEALLARLAALEAPPEQ